MKKVTLIGAASILLQLVKEPKTIEETRSQFEKRLPNNPEFLFERSMNLLANLSQVRRVDDRIVAYRSKVAPKQLLYAAVG